MSDIRKYVELIESNERVDEASKRKEALKSLNNYSYQIGLHITKVWYLPNYDSYSHWLNELVIFIDNATRKARKVGIDEKTIFEELSSDILSVQYRNKMITTIHTEYEYIVIDLDDLYSLLYDTIKQISIIIANGDRLEYNDIKDIIEENR